MPWGSYNERAVVHLNVADFAVAVERVVDSRLRQRPVLVAAQGASRAAVFDMSEEAYQAGIRKGMALRRAQKLCRDASIIPPHPHHYERAMKSFFNMALPYSPLIEAADDNGHLFMDLTGTGRLFGPPPDVAWRIRKAVKSSLGLDPIWSVAPNKLVAKVATRVVKPTGEYIVEAGEEEEFLRPLPIHLLPGLERADFFSLREFNISRVGEAALWTPQQLNIAFGKRGQYLYQAVRGVDSAPVLPVGQKPRAAHADHEFGDDTNDPALVEAALYDLTEKVGRELRERGRAARRIGIILDYIDGVRTARQKTDPGGTANDFKLFTLARAALDLAWTRRVRLRHLRLACDRLVYPPSQLSLFSTDDLDTRRAERLVTAFDQIRQRFGSSFIRVGRTMSVSA